LKIIATRDNDEQKLLYQVNNTNTELYCLQKQWENYIVLRQLLRERDFVETKKDEGQSYWHPSVQYSSTLPLRG
jgi:phage terminase small subunit